MGRNQTLTWSGGEREVVPLTRVQLPRIGSIRLERLVYRFQPEVRLPNMYILWHVLTERPDRSDPEDGVAGFIAMHQLAGMFSVGLWEPVRESEARSRVRLWAGRPGHLLPAHDEGDPSGKAASGKVAASSEAAVPGTQSWHDVVASTPDLGSWSTRTRYLELGYHDRERPSQLTSARSACLVAGGGIVGFVVGAVDDDGCYVVCQVASGVMEQLLM
ncbi:hypothetical protein OH779_39810 [Actinacidiphila glaucinigra]|uniref:hypothetical protein n=1 Tax=Actinacidiphila glaucinigra TaxID=235986 RepID=UPI00386BF35F